MGEPLRAAGRAHYAPGRERPEARSSRKLGSPIAARSLSAKVDPRGTSQTCPKCGIVAAKTLAKREHRCGMRLRSRRGDAAAKVVHFRAVGFWPGSGPWVAKPRGLPPSLTQKLSPSGDGSSQTLTPVLARAPSRFGPLRFGRLRFGPPCALAGAPDSIVRKASPGQHAWADRWRADPSFGPIPARMGRRCPGEGSPLTARAAGR
jgi:Putative transposase DNA-binding domain